MKNTGPTLMQACRKLELHALQKYTAGKVTKARFDQALAAIRKYHKALEEPKARKRRR